VGYWVLWDGTEMPDFLPWSSVRKLGVLELLAEAAQGDST